MLLIRTEPAGPALVDLLLEAQSRGCSAHLVVAQGSTARPLAAFGSDGGADTAALGQSPVMRLDPESVEQLIRELGGSLFASAGAGGEDFLRLTEPDGTDWLTCAFADSEAVVRESPESWAALAVRRPGLSEIVVGPVGADLLLEPAAETLIDQLVELPDGERFERLRAVMATAGVGDYDAISAAACAAILTLEGAYPAALGSLSWRQLGDPPSGIEGLAPQAVAVLERVRTSDTWRREWTGNGMLGAAELEVDWLLNTVQNIAPRGPAALELE